MAQILRQQGNLCSLFALASIFKHKSNMVDLQNLIATFKLDIKKGLTYIEENMVLAYLTSNAIQLVPLFLNMDNSISLDRLSNFIYSEKSHQGYARGLALLVDVGNKDKSLHRIWVFCEGHGKPIIVVDTKSSTTNEMPNIQALVLKYSVKGVSTIHSIALRSNVLFKKADIQHLF